jgi:uncharacterized membrane-anchored protein YhcB (DUF1043 family)
MDFIWDLIKQPFVWGLLLGLLVAAFIWKSSMSARRTLKRDLTRVEKEMAELQGHLNTQLKINASGNETIQSELVSLREQNENLRVNIAQLQQKPGRAELRQLHILESAARRMREQAPGFAPAWESALRDAESQAEQAESGLRKLVRKVIPAIGMGGSPGKDADAEQADA